MNQSTATPSVCGFVYFFVFLACTLLIRANLQPHPKSLAKFISGRSAAFTNDYGWPCTYCKVERRLPYTTLSLSRLYRPDRGEPNVEWLQGAIWIDAVSAFAICMACFLPLPLVKSRGRDRHHLNPGDRTAFAFNLGNLILLFTITVIVLAITLMPVSDSAFMDTPQPRLAVGGVTPPPVIVALAVAVFSGLKLCVYAAACLRSLTQPPCEDPPQRIR